MEKKEKIYIGIIVILVLVLGIVIGFLIKGNQNSSSNGNSNDNNSNKTTETKKEISDETKKELLGIVGLTEKGMKRVSLEDWKDPDQETKDKISSGNYVEITGFSLLKTFADLGKDKEIIIKDASNESISNLVVKYAMHHNLYSFDLRRTNKAGSGIDSGLSIEYYKQIAKVFNLKENGEVYFKDGIGYDGIVSGYYVFSGFGTTGSMAKIEDSIAFESKDNDIILTYNIKLDYEGEGPTNTNEKMTFTFKQYDDKTYYLHSVKTVNQ